MYTNGDKMGAFFLFIYIRVLRGCPWYPEASTSLFSDALRLSNASQMDKKFIQPFTVSSWGLFFDFWRSGTEFWFR